MLVWVACLLHSSLCVFPFLKNLLSSSSTHPRQISFLSSLHLVILTDPRQILDPSRFLGYLQIASQQFPQSIEKNSFALCLLNRFLTDPRSIKIFEFLLVRISIASQSIEISGFLLDTFSTSSLIHRDKFLCSLSTQ